jgi:hypothetical protein
VIETEKPIKPDEARELLRMSPGVEVVDDTKNKMVCLIESLSSRQRRLSGASVCACACSLSRASVCVCMQRLSLSRSRVFVCMYRLSPFCVGVSRMCASVYIRCI